MKRWDAFSTIHSHLTDQFVVCHIGPSRRDWWDVSEGTPNTFYMQGAMGMASCVGLGLAMAIPDRPTWVFEGDGALALSLNSLVTIAAKQPPNMILFVTSNRAYEAVGGQPVVTADGPDFVAIAEAMGIANVHRFSATDDLDAALPGLVEQDEFALVDLVIEQGAMAKTRMPWDPQESKYQFVRHVEAVTSLEILQN